MTMSSVTLHLGAALVLAGVFATPSYADGNRLLPFWAQPFPYGYARVEDVPPSEPICHDPFARRRDHAASQDPRCQIVLHARD